MPCCQCEGIQTVINRKQADKGSKAYRQDGPAEITRLLLDALKAEGIEGLTLLDIGSGFGAIPNELLRAGVRGATDVDASAALIETAKEEAARRVMPTATTITMEILSGSLRICRQRTL